MLPPPRSLFCRTRWNIADDDDSDLNYYLFEQLQTAHHSTYLYRQWRILTR